MESPGRPKLTDLIASIPVSDERRTALILVEASVQTELGPVVKTIRVGPRHAVGRAFVSPRLAGDSGWLAAARRHHAEPARLRSRHALLPQPQWRRAARHLRARRNPRRSRRRRVVSGLRQPCARHHRRASWRSAIATSTLRIDVDKTARRARRRWSPISRSATRYFCRLSFSAAEVDETRRATRALARQPARLPVRHLGTLERFISDVVSGFSRTVSRSA